MIVNAGLMHLSTDRPERRTICIFCRGVLPPCMAQTTYHLESSDTNGLPRMLAYHALPANEWMAKHNLTRDSRCYGVIDKRWICCLLTIICPRWRISPLLHKLTCVSILLTPKSSCCKENWTLADMVRASKCHRSASESEYAQLHHCM